MEGAKIVESGIGALEFWHYFRNLALLPAQSRHGLAFCYDPRDKFAKTLPSTAKGELGRLC